MAAIQVLGAGVMGLVTARALQARGHEVAVIDPAGGANPQSCSWWAGGMLAPYCEAANGDPLLLRYGRESLEWWRQNGASLECSGTLVLALSRDFGELQRFAARSSGHQSLTGDEIAALEPDLAARAGQALFFPDEGHLAPRDTLLNLQKFLQSAGVEFLTEPPKRSFALRVDARGLSARDELRDLRGVRGEMLVLRCPELRISRPIRLLHPRYPLYIVPRGEGVYMLGATTIESDRRGPISARSLLELLSVAYALHPAFGEAEVLETYGEARPAFADNLPKLRRRGDRLYANGLYRHGFLLAPAMAAMAVDHIEQGITPDFMDEWI